MICYHEKLTNNNNSSNTVMREKTKEIKNFMIDVEWHIIIKNVTLYVKMSANCDKMGFEYQWYGTISISTNPSFFYDTKANVSLKYIKK